MLRALFVLYLACLILSSNFLLPTEASRLARCLLSNCYNLELDSVCIALVKFV